MEGQTTDGYTVTTVEQGGTHQGEDRGRVWVRLDCADHWGNCWAIYDMRRNREMQYALFTKATHSTAQAFDDWATQDLPPRGRHHGTEKRP